MNKKIITLLVSFGFFALAIPASAADWYVDASASPDGDGTSAITATTTIQAAINAASSGDTINVASGTYDLTSRIDVNKAVTIVGDVITPSNVVINAPVAGGTQHGQNSVFMITSSNVTVQGFRIQGALHTGAAQNAGIYVDDPRLVSIPGLSNITISNNELTNNGWGIFVHNIKDSTISNNKVYSNKSTVTAGMEYDAGSGIVVYGRTEDGNHTYNLTIDNNHVYSNETDGIRVDVSSDVGASSWVNDLAITISNNTVYSNGRAILGVDKYIGIKSSGMSKGVTVSGNEIYGHTMSAAPSETNQSAGIWIPASNSWEISNNNIHDNTNGIYFLASTAVVGSGGHNIINNEVHANVRGISIDDGSEAVANNKNSIYSNDSTTFSGIGFTPYGVYNRGSSTFNTANNWWGTSDGATIALSVSGDVNYTPWYTDVGMTTLSDLKDITDFNFTSPSANGVITGTDIAVIVPFSTDVTNLTPTITTTGGSTVSPLSGVSGDFTNPVTYTVTAIDGSTQNYTVTVKQAQTITVGTNAPVNATYKSSFDVLATSDSALSVAISVTGGCSGGGLGSATITMTSGTTTCVVHYNQTGDSVYNVATEVTENVTAQKVALTIFGAVANNKQYDGNNTATVDFSGASLVGVINPDDVTIDSSPYSATFDNKNATTSKVVTVTGVTLTGADAENYTVAQPSLTADVSTVAITVSAAADSKTYDGLTTSVGSPIVTSGVIVGGDTPSWSQSYDDKNVGTNKTLTPAGTINDGNGGNNYAITFTPVTTGEIIAKSINVVADNLIKERGTSDPVLTYTGTSSLVGSDTFSGTLARDGTEDVGVYTINQGSLDAGSNYTINFTGANFTIVDTINPTASSVVIASDNASTTLAKVGDTITLSFSTSEAVNTPVVTIAGASALVTGTGPYTATYVMQGSETEGVVSFTLDFADLVGNNATQVTALTSGSGITFDMTAPVITSQSDIILEATSAAGATTTYTLITSDAVDGASVAICSPVSGTQFALGSTTVTCTKSDIVGNVATPVTFVVGVYDTTIPVITLNGSSTVSLEIHNTYTDAGATAVDIVDGNLTSSIVASSSVNQDVAGTYYVTYDVADANGNQAVQVTRTVVITDSIDTAFNGIASTIRSFGIANNMDDITTDNITNFSGLYFEKRTDVNATSTALGKITFNSALDLSNTETQTFLQNLGSKLNANTVGTIGLDLTGATNSNTLKNTSATLRFYGLNTFGFTATSTAEEINAKLVAYDDLGNAIDKSSLVSTSTPATYLGACEVNGPCYIFTVPVNHFTTYKVDNVAPTVTKLGNNSVDVALSVGNTSLVFSEELSSTSKTEVENALTAGADQSLVYAWSMGTLTITASTLTTFANDVVMNISDTAGNVTASALLVDSVLDSTQVAPSGGTATVSTTTPEVVITDPVATTTVTVSSGTTNPTIDVSAFISSNGTGTLPAINIVSANANSVEVAIPAGAVVTSADTTWNGIISAPTVTTVTLPVEFGQTKTLNTAIEVGLSGVELTFSKAVRLLLPGQASKRAGYSRNGGTTFTEITNTCVADNQVAGDALAAGAECKIDVSSDLVIWTKHFTTFASYTVTPIPGGASGWSTVGGGGSVTLTTTPPVTSSTTTNITSSTQTTGAVTTTANAPISGKVLGAVIFNFTKDLKLGGRGIDVTELQKMLINEGFLKGEATGYFGVMTKSALAKWQAKNNLPATGYFGQLSRKALLLANPTQNRGEVLGVRAYNFVRDLKYGERNSDVTELQKVLIREGLLKTDATGYFGVMTREAVSNWQKNNSLQVTGTFNKETRDLLNKKILAQ